MSENRKESFIEKFKNSKKLQIIAIILVILIVFFFFISGLFPQKNQQSNLVVEQDYFVKSLENRLSNTLSEVQGAGKVSVVITVESGMETILATKTETIENSSGKQIIETPILVNGKTVVIKEKYPQITGVLIVAEGASSISVLKKIQQATVSLLDINVNQIEILTMK